MYPAHSLTVSLWKNIAVVYFLVKAEFVKYCLELVFWFHVLVFACLEANEKHGVNVCLSSGAVMRLVKRDEHSTRSGKAIIWEAFVPWFISIHGLFLHSGTYLRHREL